MRYISSGHSHGKQITIILEGIPSNLTIDLEKINRELKRRQMTYGRGNRMKIESDEAEFISGILFGKTTGAPITIVVNNKDYENHKEYMDPFSKGSNYNKITIPRPGHADLVGAVKYNQKDMRIIFERASARETVSRVVVGAICKQILDLLDINVYSYVKNIGGIESEAKDFSVLSQSPVRMPDKCATEKAIKLIDETKRNKDTLGGIVEVVADNVLVGLGSYATSEEKLDAIIASSIISIQACKGVEFGAGFEIANKLGSVAHDEIIYDDEFLRSSNHYGGFEGGMTTGMPIVVRAVFKPVPTLMKPLQSVEIVTKRSVKSHIERSDVCIVPAASVICEHVLSYEITKAIINQFTSDTMEQLMGEVERHRKYVKRF